MKQHGNCRSLLNRVRKTRWHHKNDHLAKMLLPDLIWVLPFYYNNFFQTFIQLFYAKKTHKLTSSTLFCEISRNCGVCCNMEATALLMFAVQAGSSLWKQTDSMTPSCHETMNDRNSSSARSTCWTNAPLINVSFFSLFVCLF